MHPVQKPLFSKIIISQRLKFGKWWIIFAHSKNKIHAEVDYEKSIIASFGDLYDVWRNDGRVTDTQYSICAGHRHRITENLSKSN